MSEEDNRIYVGGKYWKSYYGAVLHNMEEDGSDNDTCYIISMGRKNNGKALDVAEVIRRDKDIEISGISIGTEEYENDDGETGQVTSLEIKMKK